MMNPSTSLSAAILPEPSTHSYLGEFEEEKTRVYFEQHEMLSIPIIYLENIVLFPTETIPLRVHDSNFASFLQTHHQSQSQSRTPILIGIIGKFREKTPSGRLSSRWHTSDIGTVAEATATQFTGAGSSGGDSGQAVLMAKGRYRFRLLPLPHSEGGGAQQRYRQRSVGGVRLHEVELLEGEEAYSRGTPSAPSARPLHPCATPRSLTFPLALSSSSSSSYGHMVAIEEDFYARGMNPLPCWLYKAHSLASLRREVLHVCAQLQLLRQGGVGEEERGDKGKVGEGYVCPIQFSYRVAAQLVVSDQERQELLEAPHVLRLRTILQHFSVQLVEEQAHRPTLPFAPNEESGVDNALSGKQRGEKRLWGSDYQYDPDHRQHDNDSDSGSKHDLEEGSSEEEVECAPHVETQAIASSAVPLTAHSQLSSPCSSNVATGGQQGQRQDSRQQIRVLLCEACEAPLAKEADVFQVPGAEGTIGAYVNPHGVIHQTLTVSKVLRPEVVHLEGDPSSEDSWFPGYSWTIAYCAACYTHLGWRFTLDTSGGSSGEEDEESYDMVSRSTDRSENGMNREIDDVDEDEGGSGYVLWTGAASGVVESAEVLPSTEAATTNNNNNINNNNNSTTCPEFWGVRRSAVKVGYLKDDDRTDRDRDRGEEAEVDRVLQMYCEQLGGVSLPPLQLRALRAQIRLLVQGQLEQEEEELEEEGQD